MRTYTLTQPAYGQPAGTSVALQEDDPLVKLNVDAGILVPGKDQAVTPEEMACPICKETMKRPPRFDSAEALSDHYADKHAGFVVPTWQADTEEE